MASPASHKNLPPAVPITMKKERSERPPRKDSLGWGTEEMLSMIAHTPPAFSPGSLTLPLKKRGRSGSISGRLLSASDLKEMGVIDGYQKGVLKDLIISGDETLQRALERFDAGDPSTLEAMLGSGALNRKSSIDLLDDLDLGFLNVGSLSDTPKDDYPAATTRTQSDEWDVLGFDSSFTDVSTRELLDNQLYSGSLGTSLANSLPSMGLGITPPAGFSFGEDFLDAQIKTEPDLETDTGAAIGSHASPSSSEVSSPSGLSTSRPIGIPGALRPYGSGDNTVTSGTTDRTTKTAFVGAYSPESRRKRVDKFLEKRQKRVWRKEVKYDVRKNFADSRLRVKGRFVKKEDEQLLRELLSLT